MRIAPTLLATIAVLATATPSRADDNAPTMTLGQVLEVTMRQKPSLQLAAIDVETADAAVLAAAGIDDWLVGSSLTFQRLRTDVTNPLTGESQATNIDNLDLSASLTKPLSTGGSVGIRLSSSRDESPFSLTSSSWSHSVLGTFYQPLLRGRGSRVARAGQRQARILRDAAELDRQAAAIGAMREVIAAYWELAYAQRDLEIRRGSLDLAKERLRITKASIAAGATAPTEALAVEQIIATREEEIVSAEYVVLDRALTLRQVAGLEISPDEMALATSAPLTVKPESFDLPALAAEAFDTSPELAALAKLEENATIDVELSENGTLPRLDATIVAGPNGTDTSLISAAGDLVTAEGFIARGTLTFEHSLGNRAARATDRDRRARLTRAKINRAEARRQIAAAMARAVASANAAAKRLELSRLAIELAEKNVQAEQTRFDLGRATNFDIAQRQEELKLSQLRFARATVDYLNAVANVDAISGRLPAKYGVTLTPAN